MVRAIRVDSEASHTAPDDKEEATLPVGFQLFSDSPKIKPERMEIAALPDQVASDWLTHSLSTYQGRSPNRRSHPCFLSLDQVGTKPDWDVDLL